MAERVEFDLKAYGSRAEQDVEVLKQTHKKLGELLQEPHLTSMEWFMSVGDCLEIFAEIHNGTYKHK
jgi:hypothetical protein